LFPDVLNPISINELIPAPANQFRGVWFEVSAKSGAKAGVYEISIDCLDAELKIIETLSIAFELLDAYLPKQKLIYTRWFHSDGICKIHEMEFASDKFWDICKKYIKMAQEHGSNMMLTPIFTPPLDTAVGCYRMTTQLVAVYKNDDKYTFSFDNLDKWIKMCFECGIQYIEMSHLFTQWGAKHAPKIMGHENGEYKMLFGWNDDSMGVGYKNFLSQFLPALRKYLEKNNLRDITYFHLSDEPYVEHLDNIKAVKEFVMQYLEGYKFIDALSSIDFSKEGLIEKPIPATNHIEPFIKENIDGLWCYYCCSQCVDVSNIFMAMPSQRTRIIALQWYKYNIEGFLQWGYNFYNSQYSKRLINPYVTTDADCAFPAGDPFIVYPGADGPVASLRLKVFNSTINDLQAMKLLEELKDKEFVMNIIEGELDEPITFSNYPRSAFYVKNVRNRINKEIKKHQSINTI
jgi:hypothetical protein